MVDFKKLLAASKTPYALLKRDWIDCQRCELCNVRKKVVLARGSIPADILFCGEAPGESEDCIGSPFVGPAGKLLDKQIGEALDNTIGQQTRLCFTNLIACIPRLETTGRKKVEPLPEEIEACRPRLDRMIEIAKPKLIVCVGELAEKEAKKQNWEERAKVVKIMHPAAILRADVVRQRLDYQRVVVTLEQAFSEL